MRYVFITILNATCFEKQLICYIFCHYAHIKLIHVRNVDEITFPNYASQLQAAFA